MLHNKHLIPNTLNDYSKFLLHVAKNLRVQCMRLCHVEPSPVCYEVSDKQRRPLVIPVSSIETLNEVHLQVICLCRTLNALCLWGLRINDGAK